MRWVVSSLAAWSCALAVVACGEEFGTGGSGGGGTGGGGASTSGVGPGGSGAGATGGGGGAVVGDCQVPDDCADKPGTSCVEGKCTCPSAAPDYCAPDGCVDTSSDLFHCGECTNKCDAGPQGAAACVEGECGFACEAGYADCTDAPGCDTPILDDPGNCGGCGIVCATQCVSDLCNDPVEIEGGENHTCARRADGSVWCWGASNWGQIGANTGTNLNPFPVKVALPAGRTALRLASGGRASCAELDDKTMFCWGGTSNNQLLGDTVDIEEVDHFAVGGTRGCATKLGVLRCWSISAMASNPIQALSTSQQVGVGGDHACAIRNGGTVSCWGENGSGQLGDGTTDDASNAVQAAGLASVDALGLGNTHSCALAGGDVWCWGAGADGRLGTGGIADELTPVQVPTLSGVDAIYTSYSHSGVRIGDKLWMWGKNDHRQAADVDDGAVTLPLEYAGLTGVTDAALGSAHTCALLQTGEVRCWGAHAFGVLGNGLTDSGETTTPTTVIWD